MSGLAYSTNPENIGAFHHRSMAVFPLRSRCISGYLVVENSDDRVKHSPESLFTFGQTAKRLE